MIQPGDHIADLILSAAIDDQLTPDEARQANAHLETCSVCRARLDELRSVVGLLRALPELEVPRDFSLGPRLVADPPNVVRLRRWYGFARAGAASLAAAFVFLSAGALYVDSQPGTSTVGLSAQSQFASAPAPAAPQSGAAVKSAPTSLAAGAQPPGRAGRAPRRGAAAPAAAPPVARQPRTAAGPPPCTRSASAAAARRPVAAPPGTGCLARRRAGGSRPAGAHRDRRRSRRPGHRGHQRSTAAYARADAGADPDPGAAPGRTATCCGHPGRFRGSATHRRRQRRHPRRPRPAGHTRHPTPPSRGIHFTYGVTN